MRQPGEYQYTFGPYAEPIARVKRGETVVIHTIDAFGDLLTSEDQSPSSILGPYLNPQTGPIYVEGAEPGDTLAVTIEAIEPARDWAVSCLVPYFGGLTSTRFTATLQDPLPEKVWLYKQTADGGFAYKDRWEIPWAPFFGTIGTAPHIEAIASLAPGAHGGNMDVPDVTVGNTVYLPVHHPGALFYTGDAHAAQGQGELCGVALEIAARGTFTFDVIKGQAIEWPRIESPDAIMVVGSARPMEDAARIAYSELIRWMETENGFDRLDAYQLLSQAGGLYVGNMVDTNYSLVAKCPKRYLPRHREGSGQPDTPPEVGV
ncbi:MAG: acetamidase/formamidase family protein [Chloroflexota bacterium]|nr:acetamidase/formamidase family protein [Chloroflexota bacterium]